MLTSEDRTSTKYSRSFGWPGRYLISSGVLFGAGVSRLCRGGKRSLEKVNWPGTRPSPTDLPDWVSAQGRLSGRLARELQAALDKAGIDVLSGHASLADLQHPSGTSEEPSFLPGGRRTKRFGGSGLSRDREETKR